MSGGTSHWVSETEERSMSIVRILLIIAILSIPISLGIFTCGGSSEELCFGPSGVYTAMPELEMNNCKNMPIQLGLATLDTRVKKIQCGERQIIKPHPKLMSNYPCYDSVQTHLVTAKDGYTGFTIYEISCPEPTVYVDCASVYILRFKKEDK